MCFGIIVLWNDFIIPRVVRIHPLASPRILHLTGRHRKLRFISDVSVDPVRVLRLAARCTAFQLDPSQLMDVVEDLLAE